MSGARSALALGLSIAAVALVALLSNARLSRPAEHAMVRLSWRTQPVRVEECRRLSEEELAALPAHMRRPEVCDGRFADYLLALYIDGQPTVLDTIRPAGVRRDRPVYVLHEVMVEPGTHRVRVDFSALLPDSLGGSASGPTYEWEGVLSLVPRQIGLITMNDEASALEIR